MSEKEYLKEWERNFYRKEGSIVAANSMSLMVPAANEDSFNRLNLCSSVIKQYVEISGAEVPLVESLYTNGLVYKSSFNIPAKEDLKILKRLDKYIGGKKTGVSIIIALGLKTKTIHTFIHKDYIPTNEGYGITNDGALKYVTEGEIVEEKTYLQKSNHYKKDGFCWGRNVLTMYNISTETSEDSILISKSLTDKVKLTKINEIVMNLNHSTRLKNYYGDNTCYKPFPMIGDEVTDDDGVFCVVSPIQNGSQLLTNADSLRTITHKDIPKFAGKGSILYDIEVYAPNENVIYDVLLKSIYLECKTFYISYLNAVLDVMAEHPEATYSFTTSYYTDFYKSLYIDGAGLKGMGDDIYRGDTHMIHFSFLKMASLGPGDKISGRHGNKGVTSDIISDEGGVMVRDVYPRGMFMTDDGREVEMILNTPGVNNRSNLGQLTEKLVNTFRHAIKCGFKEFGYDKSYEAIAIMMSMLAPEAWDEVLIDLEDNLYTKNELVDAFMTVRSLTVYINPWPEPIHHKTYNMNNAEREQIVYDWFCDNGYEGKYLRKNKILMKVNGKTLETNMVAEVSEMYVSFIEYTADKKYSVRTLGVQGSTGALSKTNRKKDGNAKFSETPIKIGLRDIVILTSRFKASDAAVLAKFILSTESETVDSFKAILEQLGVEIELNEDVIKQIRDMVLETVEEKKEEFENDVFSDL